MNHESDCGLETWVCSPASRENGNYCGKPVKGQRGQVFFCLLGIWEVILWDITALISETGLQWKQRSSYTFQLPPLALKIRFCLLFYLFFGAFSLQIDVSVSLLVYFWLLELANNSRILPLVSQWTITKFFPVCGQQQRFGKNPASWHDQSLFCAGRCCPASSAHSNVYWLL